MHNYTVDYNYYISITLLQLRTLDSDCNPLFRLDSSGDVRVGDFGLAEDVYNTGYYRQNERADIKLPYKWMALESLNDDIFTEKTDVVRFN